MSDDNNGRPIPKIVGRGKNRLKRPYTAHSYDLRSTITRCSFSEDANCSFCHFYKTSHNDLLEYNDKIRSQLLKTTTRTLIVDRSSRQKDGKIRKLRELLQERANALRDKNIEMQEYLREARLRKEELRHTVTQLQQSREEVADLHSQLEHAGKKIKTLEEVREKEILEVKKMRAPLESLIRHLSPLLLQLKDIANSDGSSEGDAQSISAKLDSLQETITLCEDELSKRDGAVEMADVCNTHDLIEKMIAEVKCGVCHDMFIDPVALPCGHVFCEFCIRMWFKRIRGCPVCRRKVITCSQLHAVYQFREIVGFLNEYRRTEEQDNRTQEIAKRAALREELYCDPLPRRMRERPSSSSDRGERFTSRRRRLENGTPSVPYPIPLPDSGLPTARLDVLPPSGNIHSPMMIPHQLQNQLSYPEVENTSNLGVQSPRNMMSFLLNETFSSIDRFIRGGPNSTAFPMIRPLNMIELPSESQSNVGETAPAVESIGMVTANPTTSGWDPNHVTVSAQLDQLDVGTSENPIIVPDYAPEELPSQTPPGTPPEESVSDNSERSEDIWSNESANVSQITSPQRLSHVENAAALPQTDVSTSSVSEHGSPEIFVQASTSLEGGELVHLMEGEFLSSSSQSDASFSETESETDLETASDEELPEGVIVEDDLEEID